MGVVERGNTQQLGGSIQPILTKRCYKKYECLKLAARELRKNQTKAEQKFWKKIKKRKILNVKFNRQQILLNSYIVDFYAPAIKLVIEIDGAYHNIPEYLEKDIDRDNTLAEENITVKRYTNIDIDNNLDLVMKDLFKLVWNKLKEKCYKYSDYL